MSWENEEDTGGSGGYAERVGVAADDVIPVAEGLDIEQAGAILAPRPGLNGLLCAGGIHESVEEKIVGFA